MFGFGSRKFNEEKDVVYNNEGYFVKNKGIFSKKTQVTVVTPVYNAAPFLANTIESVISQSLHFDNIEYILVDDRSSDSSREILWTYAKKYKNIVLVFLKENSGSPSKPRNLGIELASSEYITFLDADDRLHSEGLEALYTILKETGDDYAVGKTMKETSKEQKIIGEHQSVAERRSISPYDVPNMFQHLAPNARMMRRQLLLDYNIRFPEMKFAEDKQFFIDVLTNCKAVSTTKQVVSYLNRLDENAESLTKQTDIFEKMDSNIKVIEYVKQKNLPVEQEKIVMNRLIEFDSITRLFERQHFLKSKNKKKYYEKFHQVLDIAHDLRYDFTDNFFYPINKVIYQLFIQKDYADLESLVQWNRNEKYKQYIIKDNLPYMVVPIFHGEFRHIRVPMLALFRNGKFEGDEYKLEAQVFGDYNDSVSELVFRSRRNINEEYTFNFRVNNIAGETNATISIDQLDSLSTGSYEMFIRYNGYRKLSLLKQEQVEFERRLFNFYTTINSNLGFKISKQS
ncbi:glycosyltransferase family 2 protein [Planomicrobium sp. CPCC 101110]|uniref:glycosyltransferase family 2 protein n=1 Tax=Planomicrobium sp. CPCC 101110 TaxID=2599619 RepID=UPI0011B5197D|nr:glycosyltransferase family 2 protein [Planomicrobium sp. CPCC 101110]TWT27872.1 glycosyltransferase family 2 protein [Planomicrobium sp. CPCC 101110]